MRTLFITAALLVGTLCEGRANSKIKVLNKEPLTRRENIPDTSELERRATVRAACTNVASTVTGSAVDAALSGHNDKRATSGSSNMMAMTYDEVLASRSQQQSDTCQFDHLDAYNSACDGNGGYGQNLMVTSQKIDTSDVNAVAGVLESAMTSWWNEINNYNYDANTRSGVIGHYTQMAWATSNLVGCGVTACDQITEYTDDSKTATYVKYANGGTLVTCDYSPPGNYYGKRPFLMGDACSECGENSMDAGMGYKCENDFCVSCNLDNSGCDGCPTASCGTDAFTWCPWVSVDECASVDYYKNNCSNRCKCGDDITAHHAKCPKPTSKKRNLLKEILKLLEE